jgi:hypothetical protein
MSGQARVSYEGLESIDEWCRSSPACSGVEGGYPRHHVLVTDEATGILYEWQIRQLIRGIATSCVLRHAQPSGATANLHYF